MELNSKQVEALQQYRGEWEVFQQQIDNAKENQKQLFESLWEALAWDKKERGDDIKAVKAGFMLFHKDNAEETEKHVEDAVVVAGL